MPQRHTKMQPRPCLICKKPIPANGFGYSAHMKVHVRNGEATVTYNEQYQCREYTPVRGNHAEN